MAKHIYQKGNGNIAYTLELDKAYQLEEVRLHLSAAGGANSFTVTLDSSAGEEYDVVFTGATTDMTAATDVLWQPTRPEWINAGDGLTFAWTNASSLQWGLEIIYR